MTYPLESKAKHMRSEVFQHMLSTRGQKYRSFLRQLRLFKYLTFSPIRGKLLESYYTLMRYLDDIVDGDIPLPSGYTDEVEYITEKITFSESHENPKDQVDFLMVYCFQLAKRLNTTIHQETKDILESLLFDAKRRNKKIVFPEKTLMLHFHKLDIRGTIRGMLKIFNEDPAKYTILEPLGIASRYQYDLEDFQADLSAGYINISKEDFERFDLSFKDLHHPFSDKMRNWFCHRANQGLSLLEDHRRRLPEGRFSLLAKVVILPAVYERPARKVFQQVLSNT